MNKNSKIFIAGHNGMVGSAIVRKLKQEAYTNLIYKSSKELDLTNQQMVANFFEKEKPEYVFLAAAKVGGIMANKTYPAEFIYNNLMIQNNVIHQSYIRGVSKLLFLGSSCIYPKFAENPIKEEALLSGYLEKTNESYALAKISGIKMCEAYNSQYGCNFISVMPTNLYGFNDNYNLENSHVLPALLRKFHQAKVSNAESVTIWGTGKPMREFLHVDDLAEACLFIMNNYNKNNFLNVGYGEEISIFNLAELIKKVIKFKGSIIFDTTKPDGTMHKLIDSSQINKLGWKPKVSLEIGIKDVYTEELNKNSIFAE